MSRIIALIKRLDTAPVRKAIYGLVAAGFALAFAFGIGTAENQAVVEAALDHGFELLTALVGLMALVKTNDVPRDA